MQLKEAKGVKITKQITEREQIGHKEVVYFRFFVLFHFNSV